MTTDKRRDRTPPAPLASNRHLLRFIAIICAVSLLGWVQSRQEAPSTRASPLPLYLSLGALQLLFVWFVNLGLRARGHRLENLFGRSWAAPKDTVLDLLLAALFVAVLRASTLMLRLLLHPPLAKIGFLLPRTPTEYLLWSVVAILAGVGEELVYRGYLQTQLWSRTGHLSTAVLLQSIIFAAAHTYQGWWAAAITGMYGLAFGVLAAWRRCLIPGIMAHGAIDLIGGLIPR